MSKVYLLHNFSHAERLNRFKGSQSGIVGRRHIMLSGDPYGFQVGKFGQYYVNYDEQV